MKKNMTVAQITTKLRTSPSYLKKGDTWLSTTFGCSEKTIKQVKSSLKNVKRRYVKSLAN